MSYRQYLTDKLHLNIKTVNYHVIAVRSLLKFCLKHDINCISPDKAEIGKVPSHEVQFLEQHEIDTLLAMPYIIEQKSLKKIRDSAILHILYGS